MSSLYLGGLEDLARMGPLTLQYKNSLFDDGEDFNTSNNVLEVRDGKYIRGQIDKSVVMSGTKGILHRMF